MERSLCVIGSDVLCLGLGVASLFSAALSLILCCTALCHYPHSILQEGQAFAAAAALDTHKALVHIFFATRSTKKVRDRVLRCWW